MGSYFSSTGAEDRIVIELEDHKSNDELEHVDLSSVTRSIDAT